MSLLSVAPRLIRRFGITEGNRQTLSLGMTLDQLVNPNKYGAIEDLWLSQSPPGERLDEYVKKEWNHEAHVGETPGTILGDNPASTSGETFGYSNWALEAMLEARPLVTKNLNEFDRLLNDARCIYHLNEFYTSKVFAAEFVLRYSYSHDIQDMENAEQYLFRSYIDFQKLTYYADPAYHFANSMQTSQRKIPVRGGENGVGTNYLWSHLEPLYKKEWQDFHEKVEQLKLNTNSLAAVDEASLKPWPAAPFTLLSTNADTYKVEAGAKVFSDRKYIIEKLAPELNGLTGIRFSHEAAKSGRYEPVEIELAEPAQVLVGYFNDTRDIWLQVPKLEFAAQADERGGIETVIENAVVIQECPGVNVHAFHYEAGKQKLEFIGKGSFVILGVVPQSAKLEKRDVKAGLK